MHKIKIYGAGSGRTLVIPVLGETEPVEIVLDDGRTAQMVFREDGTLHVRAWGNTPELIGNLNITEFTAAVNFEPPKRYDAMIKEKDSRDEP